MHRVEKAKNLRFPKFQDEIFQVVNNVPGVISVYVNIILDEKNFLAPTVIYCPIFGKICKNNLTKFIMTIDYRDLVRTKWLTSPVRKPGLCAWRPIRFFKLGKVVFFVASFNHPLNPKELNGL